MKRLFHNCEETKDSTWYPVLFPVRLLRNPAAFCETKSTPQGGNLWLQDPDQSWSRMFWRNLVHTYFGLVCVGVVTDLVVFLVPLCWCDSPAAGWSQPWPPLPPGCHVPLPVTRTTVTGLSVDWETIQHHSGGRADLQFVCGNNMKPQLEAWKELTSPSPSMKTMLPPTDIFPSPFCQAPSPSPSSGTPLPAGCFCSHGCCAPAGPSRSLWGRGFVATPQYQPLHLS